MTVAFARPDYEFTDALADVIVELAHDRSGARPLVPAGADAQPGCVALAGAAYALAAGHAALGNPGGKGTAARVWPWAPAQLRLSSFSFDQAAAQAGRRRELVRAAALILKAIDAIDRSEAG